MQLSEYNTRYIDPVLQKDFEKHKKLIEWYTALCDANGIPWWKYGYEDTHSFDDYWEIRNSNNYWERFRPDLKIFYKGQYYLVDPKSTKTFIPAMGLLLNTKREYPVLYVLDKKYIVRASDILENQETYLEKMLIFTQKNEELDRLIPCKNTFHVPHEEIGASIGVVWSAKRGWFYRSGDTCVVIRDSAPLTYLETQFSFHTMGIH